MYFNIAIGTLIGGFALFSAYMVVLIYSNSLIVKKDRNHFRNSYPYNFYMDYPVVIRVVLYLLLGASILSTAIGESFFFISFNTSFGTIMAFLFPLSLVFLGVSNLLPMTYYKAHLTLASTSFFLFAAVAGLFAFTKVIPGALQDQTMVSLGFSIVIGIMGLFSLIIMFNPKLVNWAKMDKAEENGKTYYVKPKINFFALYEWIFLFEMELTALLLLLNCVITFK